MRVSDIVIRSMKVLDQTINGWGLCCPSHMTTKDPKTSQETIMTAQATTPQAPDEPVKVPPICPVGGADGKDCPCSCPNKG